ncbi:MAG: glycosyltransferase family 39 protein [Cyanothece sp. SIO1E1]|nr:glycosyltransferase family 39 protein [Cyanothece sp. SIO1E1]
MHQNFSASAYWPGGFSQGDRSIDRFWVLGFLLAALFLFTTGLGDPPLRDWDEGTIAQVAREIWRSAPGTQTWLFPTLAGSPYLNKPPLMHLIIAAAYNMGGVNEWTTRLPGALLTACSVPLLYCIGREVFVQRLPAILATSVYLTLLPLVRHGRLAMLDGAAICFFLVMVLCLLRSRRHPGWTLGLGIGFGLICLTKGALGLLLGAIALSFLAWDTPRLLTSGYLWLGLLLGSLPVAAWYAAQWLHYGKAFFETHIIDQSFSRIWQSVESHREPVWYYLLEILKYNWPWLLFYGQGLQTAWQNRNLNWSKLVLVWSGGYLLVVSLMGTKLPWYILPIYPALALAAGVQLTQLWYYPTQQLYPKFWRIIFTLLAGIGFGGSLYFGKFSPDMDLELCLILGSVGVTMMLAAILVALQDRQFLTILLWGSYISLTLLMTSQHWIWELAEAYPVKPVAAMVKQATPPGTLIYTSYPHVRPSLNFYSDRQVIPESSEALNNRWQQDLDPYLLIDENTLPALQLEQVEVIAEARDWQLIKHQRSTGN